MENMIDYIKQTPFILSDILRKKGTVSKLFLDSIKDKEIKQIYLLGSGTSCHAGIAVKHFLETILKCKVFPMFPLVFIDQEMIFDEKTLIIGISQSGTSLSTIRALDKARNDGLLTLALSGMENSEIEKHADSYIPILCGIENAVAKTKGYSATLLTLYIMGLEFAYNKKTISKIDYIEYYESLQKTIKNIDPLIDASINWYGKIKSYLIGKPQLMVIGYDANYGTMMEATLKLLETVRIAVSGYELEEFMHGIYNSINSNSTLFYIGSKSQYLDRAKKLKHYLLNTTKNQFMLSRDASDKNDFCFPFVDDKYFSTLEYIIPFQCLSYLLSVDSGIDPSQPSDPKFHKNMNSKLV